MKTNILIILLLILVGCSSDIASGSSTTVGNPMIIGVASSGGKALAKAEIYLLDTNFIPTNPDTLKPILTDASGRFSSDSRKAGPCRISMIDSTGKLGSIGDFIIAGDTVSVALNGTSFGNISSINTTEVLIIPGTPFKSTGSIAVPSGEIPSVVTINSAGTVSTIATDLNVTAGEEISIVHGFSWRNVSIPFFDHQPFAVESENGQLFVGADSLIFHRFENAYWTKKVFNAQIMVDAIIMDSTLWASTNNGIISMDKSGSALYTSANSPLSLPNSNSIAQEKGVFYAFNGSKIYSFNGANWDSTSLSKDSAHTVSALAVQNSKPIIGTNTGNIYVFEGTAWVQHKIPAFASDTIRWISPVSDTKLWVGSSSKVVLWDLSVSAQVDQLDPDVTIRDVHYDRRSDMIWILGEDFVTRLDSANNLYALTTKEIPNLSEYNSLGIGASADKVLLSSPTSVIEIFGR